MNLARPWLLVLVKDQATFAGSEYKKKSANPFKATVYVKQWLYATAIRRYNPMLFILA